MRPPGVAAGCNVHAGPMPDPASYATRDLADMVAGLLAPRVPLAARILRPLLHRALVHAAPVIVYLHDRARTDALIAAVGCGQCLSMPGQPCPTADGRPHGERRARAVRRGLVED